MAGTMWSAPVLAQQAEGPGASDDGPGARGDSTSTIIVTGRAQQLYRVEQTTPGKLPTSPLERFAGEVRAIVGNEDRYGGSAELNAPLGAGFAARGGLF